MPKLSPSQILPSDTGLKDEATKKWVRSVLNPFLDELIRKIAKADDICQVQVIELIKSGNKAGDDGNLKLSFDGANILEQVKLSGTWTTGRTISVS